jgi:hypothetical protein
METPGQFGQAGQSVTGAQQFGTAGALGAMNYQPTQFNQYQMAGPQGIRASNVFGTGYDAFGAQAAPDVTGTGYQATQAGYTPSWGAETAQQYMSPYQQAVTDIAKREATNEAQMLNRQLAGQAAKAGAFGGSRFGVEQALLGSRLATNLADIQTKGLESAYQAGMGQFNTEQAQRQAINLANQAALNQSGQFGASQAQAANLANQQMRQQANLASQQAYNQALQFGATQEQAAQIANQQARLTASQANQQMQYQTGAQNLSAMLTTQQQQDAARQAAARLGLEGAQFGAQTGLQAAERLGALGTAQQAADLQRVAAQQSAGAQQQALEQQKLDAAYQQFTEMRDWEKNQLGFLSGLIRGTPFSTQQLQTTSAPGASTASQLASLGLGAYGLSSLLGKKEGGVVKMAKGGKVDGYADGGSVSMYPDEVLQAVVQGKSDVVPAPDAERELRRRKMLRTAVSGQDAAQKLAGAMPLTDQVEDVGLAALPAGNMEFADGGIVGYDDGGYVDPFAVYQEEMGMLPQRNFWTYSSDVEEEKKRKQKAAQQAAGAVTTPTPAKKTSASVQADKTGAAVPPTTRAVKTQAAPVQAAAPAVPQLSPLEQQIRDQMTATRASNAEMMEELSKGQKDVDAIRGDIKGIAALRAAAAIAQGGPGGTIAQLGRGLGAAGEEAQRGVNLMQSARQGLMGQRLQMAQLQRQADQGDVSALLTMQQLKQQEALQQAQAEQARAYAGYLKERDRGGSSGVASLSAQRSVLTAGIKSIDDELNNLIPVTPEDKMHVADLKRQRAEYRQKLNALAGIGGDVGVPTAGAGAAPKGAEQYQRP